MTKSEEQDKIIQKWKNQLYSGQIVHHSIEPEQKGSFGAFPQFIDNRLIAAMSYMGILQPYSHQIETWNLFSQNKNTVISTPTASGKTLCYNIPASQLLLENKKTSLFMFPTKALARDQEASIRKFLSLCGVDAHAIVYDGDTPASIRKKAKTSGKIIITNPDMLHHGILPHHSSWAAFFSQLGLVVIDELHHYRGIFGSHVANVLRRLSRITSFYGAEPIFINCSATIGNPLELAQSITGKKIYSVESAGAPHGEKNFLIFNPALVDPISGLRASSLKACSKMAFDLLRKKIKTLIFCQTRRAVEIVLHYIKELFQKNNMDVNLVRGYRGGYLPNLRREIESKLKDGSLLGVVSTNALELGIDIGELDAVILTGYPGTIAGTRQRFGRAGRRGNSSLGLFIAQNKPIDQFLTQNPNYLFEASPETALISPDNIEILLAHMRCAAFELPFTRKECFGSLTNEETAYALNCLVDEGCLIESQNNYHLIKSNYPAASVNLRSSANANVVVFDFLTQEIIAEVPFHSARFELHQRAIYKHDGETYKVIEFDYEASKALVSKTEPIYYTTALDKTNIEIEKEIKKRDFFHNKLIFGEVKVIEHMLGFKKIKFKTHENLGFEEIKLPAYEINSEASWLELDFLLEQQQIPLSHFTLGLEGLSHALRIIASLKLMCDQRDINTLLHFSASDKEAMPKPMPRLFLYDMVDGSMGLAEKSFDFFPVFFEDINKLLQNCPCEEGCPACTGPIENSQDISIKDAAKTMCTALLEGM